MSAHSARRRTMQQKMPLRRSYAVDFSSIARVLVDARSLGDQCYICKLMLVDAASSSLYPALLVMQMPRSVVRGLLSRQYRVDGQRRQWLFSWSGIPLMPGNHSRAADRDKKRGVSKGRKKQQCPPKRGFSATNASTVLPETKHRPQHPWIRPGTAPSCRTWGQLGENRKRHVDPHAHGIPCAIDQRLHCSRRYGG